ncbi:MAG: NAD(P)-dependent oxidoreductase [archaeon]|nr:NAD(P)-dependent oxidoreductase [archaeon]
MKKNKILITGTSGFLGKHLKRHCEQKGFDVYGTTFLKLLNDEKEIQFDISKELEIEKLWDDDFKIIIHSAGCVNQKKSKEFMNAVNVQGTLNMVRFAKEHGCGHLIFLSSVAIYKRPVGQHLTEDAPRLEDSGNPYGLSKALAEKVIEESGIPYTILRLPMVLGEGDDSIVNNIVSCFDNNILITVGNKRKKVSIMNCKNFTSLIMKIIERGPLNDFFNAISQEAYWDEFMEEHAKILGNAYKPINKTKISLISNLILNRLFHKEINMEYIVPAVNSCFGSHFESNKLKSVFPDYIPEESWEEAVKEGIVSYRNKTKSII